MGTLLNPTSGSLNERVYIPKICPDPNSYVETLKHSQLLRVSMLGGRDSS